MKLAVASLIRNEIDIIGAFLQHLDALFDYALLMDHHSIDGTDRMIETACARRDGWTMWRIKPIGYHQTAFSAFALRHLFQQTDADIFIFLDADEFINVPDRAHLEAAFGRLVDPDRIGELVWHDSVADRTDTRAIVPGEGIWLRSSASQWGKVVISRPYLLRHGQEAHLVMGNHCLHYPPAQRVPSDRVGDIVHLPIRSHSQLRGKVLVGVFSLIARVQRRPEDGWHWYDILDRLGAGTLRDDDLLGIAVHYGERDNQTTPPLSRSELPAMGFIRTALDVAFGRPLPEVLEPLSVDPVRLIASIARGFEMEDLQGGDLRLEGDRLHLIPQDSQVVP